MKQFEIGDEFLINGKPVKLLSGAIHYFRIVPEHWEHSLYNLKALGFNTVETYIPWNLHEMEEGQFDFSGNKDVAAFVKKAQEIGLMVILRPGPYICAEWDFGGLPAWLLNEPALKLRCHCPLFLEKVRNYFNVLLPLLTPLQVTEGGPVIMMQVENEYGSFDNDKDYLRALKVMMTEAGVNVPLFTSDGSWDQALMAGTLIEDNILVTGNFGSRVNENLDNLERFMKVHHKKWPFMCMEFWCGWFNRWNEDIILRDADDVKNCVKELLQRASLNLYMFHGGTNFGFMNGACAGEFGSLPQVTSYDYDAFLTEWGDPTPKYYAVQKLLHELFPDTWQQKPRIKTKKAYGEIRLSRRVSLFNTLDSIAKKQVSVIPKTMEQLGNGFGYVLYQTQILGTGNSERVKIVDASDRVQVYLNRKLQTVQYQSEIGQEFNVQVSGEQELSLLVENMGRNNYGYKLLAPAQRKGIRSGVMVDNHFEMNWTQYALPLDNIEQVDFTKEWISNTPAFYEYEFEVDVTEDTFLDCSQLGKGVAFINGFNLGRYWNVGPIQYLYIPGPLLKIGINKLVIFETEGNVALKLELKDHPVFKADKSSEKFIKF